jgi:hypothetical protein
MPGSGPPTISLEHWIFGVTAGEGYGVKGQSAGLNLSFYAPRLEGHYTPVRGETAQSSEGELDLVMVHPATSGRELLYSVIGRGPDDELGRPTFANHTAVIPLEGLRSGSLALPRVDEAIRAFDRADPDAGGTLSPVEVPPDGLSAAWPELSRLMTPGAGETLLTRWLDDADARTLLLTRDASMEIRRATLVRVVEAFHLRCGLPVVPSLSDGPPSSQLRNFQLVISPRGVRADTSWALLDASADKPSLPRHEGEEERYRTLLESFGARA